MLVRALVPLTLSSAILLLGPSAQGDLELSNPAPVVSVKTAAPPAAVAPQTFAAFDPTAPLDPLTESLLASRLEALDREIPGLAGI